MGSTASKQSRSLPGSVGILAQSTKLSNRVTNHKIELHHERTRIPKHKDNTPSQDTKIASNVDRIGFIRTEEVPFRLDLNNTTIKTLQNRKSLDESLKNSYKTEGPRVSVQPGVFCSIVADIALHPSTQLSRNYGISENFINIVKEAGVAIATQKVEVKEGARRDPSTVKSSKNGWDKEEYIHHRINGIPTATKSKLESSLEQLMNPNP